MKNWTVKATDIKTGKTAIYPFNSKAEAEAEAESLNKALGFISKFEVIETEEAHIVLGGHNFVY